MHEWLCCVTSNRLATNCRLGTKRRLDSIDDIKKKLHDSGFLFKKGLYFRAQKCLWEHVFLERLWFNQIKSSTFFQSRLCCWVFNKISFNVTNCDWQPSIAYEWRVYFLYCYERSCMYVYLIDLSALGLISGPMK